MSEKIDNPSLSSLKQPYCERLEQQMEQCLLHLSRLDALLDECSMQVLQEYKKHFERLEERLTGLKLRQLDLDVMLRLYELGIVIDQYAPQIDQLELIVQMRYKHYGEEPAVSVLIQWCNAQDNALEQTSFRQMSQKDQQRWQELEHFKDHLEEVLKCIDLDHLESKISSSGGDNQIVFVDVHKHYEGTLSQLMEPKMWSCYESLCLQQTAQSTEKTKNENTMGSKMRAERKKVSI